MNSANIPKTLKEPLTTYHEKKIGNTLFRVTSVYLGQIELGKAIEDLTVRKILAQENTSPQIEYAGSQM